MHTSLNNKDLLSITQAAEMADCTRAAVYKWIAQGIIVPEIIAGRPLVTPDHVEVMKLRMKKWNRRG